MTKTILITGATAGFGAAAARRFASGGWRVIGTGRRAERLRALADGLGDAFLPLEIDMRDREAVESLAALSPPWGEIDLLLNNAGLAPPMTPMPETDWERIAEVLDTNIAGLVALTRSLLPKIVERKGQEFELDLKDLAARCVLHETDHCDGIVFLDRMSSLKRQLAKRKIKALQKTGKWE